VWGGGWGGGEWGEEGGVEDCRTAATQKIPILKKARFVDTMTSNVSRDSPIAEISH
jgi:hypothetical protein